MIAHRLVVGTGRTAIALLRGLALWERASAEAARDVAHARDARAMARLLEVCADRIEAELPSPVGSEGPRPEPYPHRGEDDGQENNQPRMRRP